MAVAQASALQDALTTKMDELESGLRGISDADASRKPGADEWSVKELLSHLSGENDDFLRWVRQIAETDTPELDLVPNQTHFSAQRESKSVAVLLADVRRQYDQIGEFVAGLDEEQLNRKAHIGLLKETPFGEYPTLAQWTQLIIDYHLADHVRSLPAMREKLGV